MKKLIIFLVLMVAVTGCTKTSETSEGDMHAHKETVSSNNKVDAQSYTNDYIGIRVNLPDAFEIYDYKDMNLSSMPDDTTILLYATMNNSFETIVITESLYDGSDYRKQTIEELKKKSDKNAYVAEFQESDTTIGGKEAYYVKVTEKADEKPNVYIDQYFIEQGESLVSIMVAYDENTDVSIINTVIEGIEFDL